MQDFVRELQVRLKLADSNNLVGELSSELQPMHGESNDPLAMHGVKIVDFDIDTSTHELRIVLDRSVTPKWIQAFNQPSRWYSSLVAGDFHVSNSAARISIGPDASPMEVQKASNCFKDYLQQANDSYRALVQREAAEAERQRQEYVKDRIQSEKKRQEILAILKL